MSGIRSKNQSGYNNNVSLKIINKKQTSTTTIIETRSNQPFSSRVVEQRVSKELNPYPNNRRNQYPAVVGRSSAVLSYKRDNDIIINTNTRDKPREWNRNINNKPSNVASIKSSASTTAIDTGKPNYRWSVAEQKFEREPFNWGNRFSKNKDPEKPKEEVKIQKTPSAYNLFFKQKKYNIIYNIFILR